MVCPFCGKVIPDDVNTCPSCKRWLVGDQKGTIDKDEHFTATDEDITFGKSSVIIAYALFLVGLVWMVPGVGYQRVVFFVVFALVAGLFLFKFLKLDIQKKSKSMIRRAQVISALGIMIMVGFIATYYIKADAVNQHMLLKSEKSAPIGFTATYNSEVPGFQEAHVKINDHTIAPNYINLERKKDMEKLIVTAKIGEKSGVTECAPQFEEENFKGGGWQQAVDVKADDGTKLATVTITLKYKETFWDTIFYKFTVSEEQ